MSTAKLIKKITVLIYREQIAKSIVRILKENNLHFDSGEKWKENEGAVIEIGGDDPAIYWYDNHAIDYGEAMRGRIDSLNMNQKEFELKFRKMLASDFTDIEIYGDSATFKQNGDLEVGCTVIPFSIVKLLHAICKKNHIKNKKK